jgi:CDGSH-type Zn-finger protein/uncharacterized Fe-S cluster protein YjdI
MNSVKTSVVIESRAQLFSTLAEAAEIEHNLMCLYLYAMFSLKRDVSEDIRPEELEAVGRWRKIILGIALEEMNHLTLVSNLSVAVGSSPQLMRPNFPAYPGMYPSNIVIELAPFNLATLEHFIYLERPRSIEIEDADEFRPGHTYTREAPHGTLNPHSGDYRTIGTLYLTIRESLTALCKQYGEKALFSGSTHRQIGPLDAPLPGLRIITDRESAEQALDTIVTQGEGALTIEGSHFARFRSIKEEYEELLKKNPDFEPGRCVARNPIMRKPVNPEGKVWVQEPLAAEYMDLANALYLLMVRLLVQVYAFEDRETDNKRMLLNISFEMMHAMANIGEMLTHMPANEDSPDVHAGMSFAMARSLAPLDRGAEHILLIERLKEIEEHFGRLQTDLDRKLTASSTMDVCILEIAKMKNRFRQIREKVAENYSAIEKRQPPPSPQAKIEPSKKATAVAANAARSKPLDHGPSANEPAPAPLSNSAIEYAESNQIKISFETKKCIHARHCVTELPNVFKANTPGEWLFPETADPEMLASVIRKCPSGALQYMRKDDGLNEQPPEVNMIRLRENGPYAINADMEIDGRKIGYRATLCRCGLSSNKPLCDGTHVSARFQATAEPPTVDATALKARDGLVRIRRTYNGPLELKGNLELCTGTGRIVVRTTEVHLCRCGHSQNKPICDSSHVAAGFMDDPKIPTDEIQFRTEPVSP